jgi:hypothetical protein
MIDLSGLFTHDVEIRMQGDGFIVVTHSTTVINDTLGLPAPIWSHEVNKGHVLVSPHGTHCIALAERLALHWESQGYKVKRIVAPLHTVGSNNEVQSFILT